MTRNYKVSVLAEFEYRGWPETISRVFKMKLDSLMTDLTDNEILGKTVACKFIFLLISKTKIDI